MTTFLDTSVLIAASDAEHPHHAASVRYLELANTDDTACAAHTLAEVYAVLSRLPGGKRRRPELAAVLVRQIAERVRIVPLTADEYVATIGECAEAGHDGGKTYDALLLACARKVGAERVVTWNVRHFREIAPDTATSIMEP